MASEYIRVWLPPCQFVIETSIGVDPVTCERFFRSFVKRNGKLGREEFKAALDTEFSDWFECGVISGWHLPDTEHIVVTVSSIGTENTRPARRPKGLEPTDR